MEWLGILCLRCRAQNDFEAHGDHMGLWVFQDYPAATFIYLSCHACMHGSNIYLGDTWQEDTAYLESIGIGTSTVGASPWHVLQGYKDTFGYFPLDAHQEKEIQFAHYLIGHQAAEMSLTEWESHG